MQPPLPLPSPAPTIPPPVAATAGSAAFCKWSLFRRGFLDAWGLPPETLVLLAALAGVDDDPSAASASPLAHRCYHLRAAVAGEALRRAWDRWLPGRSPDRPQGTGSVVVLGAGMDGLALASLARALEGHAEEAEAVGAGAAMRLIEVDCPEVVARKRAALDAFAAGAAASGGGNDAAGAIERLLRQGGGQQRYHLVAADLRDPVGSLAGVLGPFLQLAEDDKQEEVLFVLEAVLGYLSPAEAEALLRWISAAHPRAAVLVIDTGRVAALAEADHDAVAVAVRGAFAARGCPLEGLGPWARDGASVTAAFRRWGLPLAWPSDLWAAGAALVPSERLLLLPSLAGSADSEPFDEYAAWQLFARQSLVAVGATAGARPLFQALTTALCPDPQDTIPSTTIRCFQPGDAAAVRGLVAAGRAGAAAGRPAVARFLRKALDGDLVAMDERYGGGERFWVVVTLDPTAAVVVGCVGLRLGAAAEGKAEGEIVRLTVADGWQRRGLGRRLLRHAEAHARTIGVRVLHATTLDEAALPGACAFYRREGYALERRQPFGGGSGQGQLCHMVKRLEGGGGGGGDGGGEEV